MTELRATILVIEDEPAIRAVLRTAFGIEGYRVVESATGRRGSIDAGTQSLNSYRSPSKHSIIAIYNRVPGRDLNRVAI